MVTSKDLLDFFQYDHNPKPSLEASTTYNFNDKIKFDYDYLFTDFTTITSKKVGLNNPISGGYTLRVVDKDLVYRFIQKFALTKQYTSISLAHRSSIDQTFVALDAI